MNLRAAVIDSYISSSSGVHVAASPTEIRRYIRAYRFYLRGWLKPTLGQRWLDLGCGQGHIMCLARELGYAQIEGVDSSGEMVELASRAGLNVRQADVFETLMASEAESYDILSCFDLLEHFDKENGFNLIKKMYSVLSPGGTLLLKLPNAYSPWGMGITANDLTHEAAYTHATLLQLGQLAGFENGAVREIGPAPWSLTGAPRWVLWQNLRALLIAWDIIETGHPRTSIYTRVMLGRFVKHGRFIEQPVGPAELK